METRREILSTKVSMRKVSISKSNSFLVQALKYKSFYIMLLPMIIFYIAFCYMPMYGVSLAFKTFDFSKGIMGSPWVGFQHFKELAGDQQFLNSVKNTLIISLGRLAFNFPLPIVLALFLNELMKVKLKKFYQTVFTLPHFISWVVISGIIINIFGSSGAFNQIISLFGIKPFSPLIQTNTFRAMLYITNAWKEMGWDTIIYLAALAGISPELYESAEIDGANRIQKLVNITWPGIKSTVSILLILAVGNVMGGGALDQVINLYSAPVYSVADTIDTYIYRTTFTVGTDFGYMTAIGLSKSLINLILLYSANWFAKRFEGNGVF